MDEVTLALLMAAGFSGSGGGSGGGEGGSDNPSESPIVTIALTPDGLGINKTFNELVALVEAGKTVRLVHIQEEFGIKNWGVFLLGQLQYQPSYNDGVEDVPPYYSAYFSDGAGFSVEFYAEDPDTGMSTQGWS